MTKDHLSHLLSTSRQRICQTLFFSQAPTKESSTLCLNFQPKNTSTSSCSQPKPIVDETNAIKAATQRTGAHLSRAENYVAEVSCFIVWLLPRSAGQRMMIVIEESRSKTHKKLKERFLIRRNRTKHANFRCNHLFQVTYNTTENSQMNLSLSVRCQEAGGRKRARGCLDEKRRRA